MNAKLRLNIQFGPKKFMLAVTNPATTMGQLKATIAERLGLTAQLAEMNIFSTDAACLDMDPSELASNLLDDKQTLEVLLGGATPLDAPPIQLPHVFPQTNSIAHSAPQEGPPLQPMAPSPASSMGPLFPHPFAPIPAMAPAPAVEPPMPGKFRYFFYKKETGFANEASFPAPYASETLGTYGNRLLAALGIPVAQFAALVYHRSGAPLSLGIAQQELVLCSEVLDMNSVHYVIVVPRSIETPQDSISADPRVGPDLIKVGHLGRSMPVQIELGRTTVRELKYKLTRLVKVSIFRSLYRG